MKAAAGAVAALAIPVPDESAVVFAKGPEMDAKSGEQFVPRSECACNALKREATEDDRSRRRRRIATQSTTFQEVYDVRFVAYLSRFLLNYDPAAKAWFQVRFNFIDEVRVPRKENIGIREHNPNVSV